MLVCDTGYLTNIKNMDCFCVLIISYQSDKQAIIIAIAVIDIIKRCDSTWEKGPVHAYNDFAI